jgi:hypothetical protein
MPPVGPDLLRKKTRFPRFIGLGKLILMKPEAIRELLRRQPFIPFTVHMTSGEAYRVQHPEQVLIAGGLLLIYYQGEDRIAYCSFLHIANVVVETTTAA